MGGLGSYSNYRLQITDSDSKLQAPVYFPILQVADYRYRFQAPGPRVFSDFASCKLQIQDSGDRSFSQIFHSAEISSCSFTLQGFGTRDERVESASASCRSTLQQFGTREALNLHQRYPQSLQIQCADPCFRTLVPGGGEKEGNIHSHPL